VEGEKGEEEKRPRHEDQSHENVVPTGRQWTAHGTGGGGVERWAAYSGIHW